MSKYGGDSTVNHTPRAAVVQDLSAFGRCSLTVALPVLSVLGVQCCPLATALLSTHTGLAGNTFLDLTGQLAPAMDHWARLNLSFDALYSGFLGSEAQAELVRRFRTQFHPQLVLVDPVMGDHGKAYRTCTPTLCRAVMALAEEADLITPNLTEAALLLGLPPEARPRGEGELSRWAWKLSREGRRSVVITGVTGGEGRTGAYCWDREGNRHGPVWAERIPQSYPGTGDLFASVLLGRLLEGRPLQEAAAWAAVFVSACAKHTLTAGTPPQYGVELEAMLPRLMTPRTNKEDVL
ncbi:MAG: pyridoxamine kinase [Oscillospiraceae bacterium]|nr:pyridoxamine kinase [Oscillospiraceae bacterium]